jgi:hypothetical protein
LKHESTDKDKIAFGKTLWYFYHAPNATQTVGTEFSMDWPKNTLEARLGMTHKFSDDVTGKIKANNVGKIDAALKFKVSDVMTASVTSGLCVTNIAE